MIGATVGNYQVREEIGHGGMGVVYAAEHPLIGRKVAVKVLLPEYSRNQEVVNRFFNEARAVTMIRHPGLVDVIDFGYYDDGSAYLVMEFLEGESLASRLKREGKLPVADIVALGKQVAAALGAAHDKGIIHRDLKPDNIFLVPDRELAGSTRCKILDFGIAKLTSHEAPGPNTPGGSLKTRTGVVMGTPLYMSPEQGGGASQVDARADIYSLGCILYEMATGRVPFIKEGFGEVIAAHIYEQPLAPREIEPTVPRVLQELILKALKKKPDERQQKMTELARELTAVADAPAEEPEQIPFDESPLKKHWVKIVGGLVAIVMVATTIALVTKKPPAKKPSAAVVTAAAVGPTPTPTPTKTPTVEKPKVKLRIESEPTGAEVYRVADGMLVGMTPLTQEVAPSDGKAVFVLRMSGYADGRAELGADRDGTTRVEMTKLKTKAHVAHAPADKPAPRKRVRDGALDPFAQ